MDIDFVIAWVEGSDPAWQAEKAKFPAPEADGPNRYRELGLLKYWFRAVERNAPWVRRIHFVTWGHVPEFLDLTHPKLRIVTHREFIPARFLPTFSSHTIELNLHRIPGLAEHFVYFNDDMFLLRRAEPTDFFRGGLPCLCGRESPWIFRGPVGVWSHAAANDLGVINRHFAGKSPRRHQGRWQDRLRSWALGRLYPDSFTGFVNVHGPSAFRRETFLRVWAAEPELLEQTCTRRFRSALDVNQWLMLWWQIAGGEFVPREPDNLVLDLTPENIHALCRAVTEGQYASLCVNDPGGEVPVRPLADAFQSVFPEKSAFEL